MIFHLAIPAKDLAESEKFYTSSRFTLWSRVLRREKAHIVLDFFGHQLVLHKSDKIDGPDVSMYPRHFGIIVQKPSQFNMLWDYMKGSKDVWSPEITRNEGLKNEHRTFFLKDPSNNLIEFKYYSTLAM